MPDLDAEAARKINEVAGMAAALFAVVAQLPSVTPEVVQAARKLMGTISPGPAPNSPGGSAPPIYGTSILDRLEAIAKNRPAQDQ